MGTLPIKLSEAGTCQKRGHVGNFNSTLPTLSCTVTPWSLSWLPAALRCEILAVLLQQMLSAISCLWLGNLSILQTKGADPLIRSSCSLSLRSLWLLRRLYLGKTGIVTEGEQGQLTKHGQKMLHALAEMICDWITFCLCQDPAR